MLSVAKLYPRHPALERLNRGKETIAGVEVRRKAGNLLRFTIRLGPSVLRATSKADGGWGTVQDCAAFNPNSAALHRVLSPVRVEGRSSSCRHSGTEPV